MLSTAVSPSNHASSLPAHAACEGPAYLSHSAAPPDCSSSLLIFGTLISRVSSNGDFVKGGLDRFPHTLAEKPPLGGFIRVQPWMWFHSELCLLARGVRIGLQLLVEYEYLRPA